jgi:hypothetical protein
MHSSGRSGRNHGCSTLEEWVRRNEVWPKSRGHDENSSLGLSPEKSSASGSGVYAVGGGGLGFKDEDVVGNWEVESETGEEEWLGELGIWIYVRFLWVKVGLELDLDDTVFEVESEYGVEKVIDVVSEDGELGRSRSQSSSASSLTNINVITR